MSARVVCGCGWSKSYPTMAQAEAWARRHVCPHRDHVRRATRRYRCARCGLEAVYEDAGAAEARRWFNRHSCQKREQAMLRATFAAQREALIDRTPQPCHHKVAHHEHGTRACYVLDKCRCLPCSAANSEAETTRERQKAYGRYAKYVPAGPVREHVLALAEAGMGLKRLVVVSGVSQGCLWKLVYGKRQPDGSQVPSRRVLRTTAEALFAVDPDWNGPLDLADGAMLSLDASARAHRQLQALVALGWSMAEIGRRLGIEWTGNACPIVKGERPLRVSTARKAEALFHELCMTLPPETTHRERLVASRARNFAKAHGWLPPLALDDDDRADDGLEDDDVDEVAVQRRMNGDTTVRLNHAERLVLVQRCRQQGWSYLDIERTTHVAKPERYIQRQEDAS